MTNEQNNLIKEVASRIREMREIMSLSIETMAEKTGLTRAQYADYENGVADLPFSFIHKCAMVFGIDIADLLEGHSPRLTSYQVTRGPASTAFSRSSLATEAGRSTTSPAAIRSATWGSSCLISGIVYQLNS